MCLGALYVVHTFADALNKLRYVALISPRGDTITPSLVPNFAHNNTPESYLRTRIYSYFMCLYFVITYKFPIITHNIKYE